MYVMFTIIINSSIKNNTDMSTKEQALILYLELLSSSVFLLLVFASFVPCQQQKAYPVFAAIKILVIPQQMCQ